MDDKKALAKVKDFFHRDAENFDEHWKEKPKFNSLVRWLIDRFYRDKTFARLEAVLELSGEPKAGKKVLEVGSGSGRYSVAFAERGANVLGIDFAPQMVELAKKLAELKGVSNSCKFEVADILYFNGNDDFDIIYAAGVFDYIPPAPRAPMLKKMAQLSKGKIIFTYPKKGTLHSFVRKIWLSLKGVQVYFYSRKEVISLAREAGLAIGDFRDIGTLVIQSCSPITRNYEE